MRCWDRSCVHRSSRWLLLYDLNPTSFVWSIIESVVNEIELDLVIRDQGDHRTCTVHALIAGMDLKRRIYGALFGLYVPQELDIRDLLMKFFWRFGEVLGHEKTRDLISHRIHCLMSIAQVEGVGYENASAMVPDVYPVAPLGRVLKVAACFFVTKDMVDRIVRLLAGGFPLVTAVPTGRCFRYVAAGQIYNAPSIPQNHAVLLIGFGTAPWPGDDFAQQNSAVTANWPTDPTTGDKRLRTFYRARGSSGDLQHPDYQLDGFGGDFDIWAEDIHEVLWGFNLTEDIPWCLSP